MPVHTQTDALLTITLGGVDYACQVVNASFQPAAPGESSPIPVACGDTVSEPGDPANGSISGEVLKDTTATGVTRVLAKAVVDGTEFDYTYVENAGTDHEMSWSGKATVPSFAIDFAPSKMGRHPLALTLTTSVLADLV